VGRLNVKIRNCVQADKSRVMDVELTNPQCPNGRSLSLRFVVSVEQAKTIISAFGSALLGYPVVEQQSED
jgi:hypothetical protein